MQNKLCFQYNKWTMARVHFANPVFYRAYEQIDAGLLAHPYIVFCGRSNAGKSSVLNALCNGRFAYVSRTPGRTQAINLYRLPGFYLADLPGYGYAAVSAQTRRTWKTLLPQFLQTATIRLLLLVVDCRRGVLPVDEQLLALCQPRGVPVHIVLNKADKLNRQQQQHAVAAAHSATACPVTLFSATRKVGVVAVRQAIATAV